MGSTGCLGIICCNNPLTFNVPKKINWLDSIWGNISCWWIKSLNNKGKARWKVYIERFLFQGHSISFNWSKFYHLFLEHGVLSCSQLKGGHFYKIQKNSYFFQLINTPTPILQYFPERSTSLFLNTSFPEIKTKWIVKFSKN